MDKNTLETLAVMGERQNRDTAHLLDLVIAGTIDHLHGHGTVRLLPLRLEEIADRIGPRTRDADGAWIVTLFPPNGDDLAPVNPYDVLAYVREVETIPYEEADPQSPERIAALVTAAAMPGVTLRDLAAHECGRAFAEWAVKRYAEAAVDNQPG